MTFNRTQLFVIKFLQLKNTLIAHRNTVDSVVKIILRLPIIAIHPVLIFHY
jgi:hypothetical protein